MNAGDRTQITPANTTTTPEDPHEMTAIPKTRMRQTLGRDNVTAFLGPLRYRWEVTLDGQPIAEFDNHRDALAYAHRRATTAQREHVEKLEHAAYEARRAAEKAAGKRPTEFMDWTGRIWALAA